MGQSDSYVKVTEEWLVVYPDGMKNLYERKRSIEICETEEDLIKKVQQHGLNESKRLTKALNEAKASK